MSNQITPNPSVPSQVVAEVKFPRWINNLGIIPTSYKDSMSYYECLAWLCKFLEETVIPSINENGEAVEELQNLYIELNSYVTHYFETLDVQEEINNKLDEMVEDGTLPEIVASYLQTKAVFGFDTVENLKNGENLINGSYAETLGFYSRNDGGSALYKIRTLEAGETVDEIFLIGITNTNLVAELIKDSPLNIRKVGMSEDMDNASILEYLISKDITNLYFPKGIYEISRQITTKEVFWKLDKNAEIKATNNMNCMFAINTNSSVRSKNMFINGGVFNGDSKAKLILGIDNSQYLTIENSYFENYTEKGIELDYLTSSPGTAGASFIRNCIFYGISNNETEIGLNMKTANDCWIEDCVFKDNKICINIKGGNIKVSGCHGWNNTETKYIGSIFADISQAGRTSFDSCVFDTIQYPIYSGTYEMYTQASNLMFMNRSSYASTNIPVIFNSSTTFTNNNSTITLNGLLIAANSGKVKIISDRLLTRINFIDKLSFTGLPSYESVSNVEILNNPQNTAQYSYKVSSGSNLTKSSNFDTLNKNTILYPLNMFSGSDGTNIPGTDFTGVLYQVINNEDANSDKRNGIQIVLTSTGKLIFRYLKTGTWTSWQTLSI